MMMDTITLVGTQTPKGVFEPSVKSQTVVPCKVRSVTRSEAYQAKAVGLNPSIVFELAVAEDYQRQRTIIFHGVEYRVVRTYQSDFGLEIVCEEATYDQN